MKGAAIKICPKCGKSFSCYGENDCWCENVRINKRDMMIIMQNFDDCLCPECIREYECKD